MTAPASTFFIGIVPPPPFAARVRAWQAKLNHDVPEPHVTLLAPAPVPEARWHAVAALVATRRTAAEVRLGGVERFGDRVIFLKVDAPELGILHRDLVETLGEAPGEFALDKYHPHLTLALSWRPMNSGWTEALKSAQAEFGFIDLAPLSFEARELVLFGKAAPGHPYTERQRFALGRAL
ncbi:hypothetical protein DKM44_01475 [Deinococcus irradiatisoli]|uniref:2'-5' RNA ligase n=1 Tax=Deinococcus irradiatisoli TaxID=2202254 RepID=A0A2Z3JAP4_9DEIO|nr:2'-5' RNA ligase family protein [Deinococcus irradiatisoli]AWN22072.1 hypothetical protein DKM44_01475 [Deinococcus irradiatisoli]